MMKKGERGDRQQRPDDRTLRLVAGLFFVFAVLRVTVWRGDWVQTVVFLVLGLLFFLSTIEPTRRFLR